MDGSAWTLADTALVAIDFEASSLGRAGYPIEVGIALWRGEGQPIERWSSIIRPAPAWERLGQWSKKSEAVHGIARDQLMSAGALSPLEVAQQLNLKIGQAVAWCDGGEFDGFWQNQLLIAARLPASWQLRDIASITNVYPGFNWAKFRAWLALSPAAHRAQADAERLLMAIRAGLQMP